MHNAIIQYKELENFLSEPSHRLNTYIFFKKITQKIFYTMSARVAEFTPGHLEYPEQSQFGNDHFPN